MAKKNGLLFPELEEIIAVLRSGESPQEMVILAIPSHDKKNKPLNDQSEWADAALRLFADLYRGATAFQTFKGIYKTDRGQYLFDEPILVESYADAQRAFDEACLTELVMFAKRMGRETRQEAVMIIIGKARFYIEDFSQRK